MKAKRSLPYLALVTGICALSMTGIFVRWAQAPGTVTAAYRMSISALVFLPFFLKKEAARPPRGRGWIFFVLLGGLFVAGDHGFLNTAVGLTRIANTTLLNNMAPLWVALFALLVWKEKLNRTFWLGCWQPWQERWSSWVPICCATPSLAWATRWRSSQASFTLPISSTPSIPARKSAPCVTSFW